MKQKADNSTCETIKLEEPLFAIVFKKNNTNFLDLHRIIFKNTPLYSLFKQFTDNSTKPGMTLTEYLGKFDDNTQSVTLSSHFGKENIIGKFLLETNLDWPRYETNHPFSPRYKQPVMKMSEQQLKECYNKGVPQILLGQWDCVCIPESIIALMNSFKPNNEIKQVASLAAQAFRTSPASKFLFFKQDWFVSEIAQYFEPEHDKPYAASKLKNEIVKSNKFQEDLQAPKCCIL